MQQARFSTAIILFITLFLVNNSIGTYSKLISNISLAEIEIEIEKVGEHGDQEHIIADGVITSSTSLVSPQYIINKNIIFEIPSLINKINSNTAHGRAPPLNS